MASTTNPTERPWAASGPPDEPSGEIEWLNDDRSGGSVVIEPTGISVYTECCGCASTELRDREKLRGLRDAIDLILSYPEETMPS